MLKTGAYCTDSHECALHKQDGTYPATRLDQLPEASYEFASTGKKEMRPTQCAACSDQHQCTQLTKGMRALGFSSSGGTGNCRPGSVKVRLTLLIRIWPSLHPAEHVLFVALVEFDSMGLHGGLKGITEVNDECNVCADDCVVLC